MRRLVLVAAALLATAGCGSSGSGTPSTVEIVAGFYPLQFVAEQVGGDRVTVTNLAPPGAEPHDMELEPSQVASIADAGLVVYLRGFQPAVDEAVDQEAKESAFDVTTAVPLVEHEGVEPEEDADHVAEAGAKDPHIWLDPTRLATIATALADRLATDDPAGASAYRDRARDLGTRLQALDKEYADGLKDCQRRDIVTSHASFGYLADRYGLHQIPVTGLTPEVEPTPGELAAVADAARKVGATTIFFETLVSPKVAQTVADAIGAKTAVLDPIEGLEPGSTDDYLSVMRSNLVTLRSALGCT